MKTAITVCRGITIVKVVARERQSRQWKRPSRTIKQTWFQKLRYNGDIEDDNGMKSEEEIQNAIELYADMVQKICVLHMKQRQMPRMCSRQSF